MTALAPSADAAPAIVNVSIFPLYFVSNVFIPISNPPQRLNVLTHIFPIGSFNEAIKTAVVRRWGAARTEFARAARPSPITSPPHRTLSSPMDGTTSRRRL